MTSIRKVQRKVRTEMKLIRKILEESSRSSPSKGRIFDEDFGPRKSQNYRASEEQDVK